MDPTLKQKLSKICTDHPDVEKWLGDLNAALGQADTLIESANDHIEQQANLINRMGTIILSLLREHGLSSYTAKGLGKGEAQKLAVSMHTDPVEVYIEGESNDQEDQGIRMH